MPYWLVSGALQSLTELECREPVDGAPVSSAVQAVTLPWPGVAGGALCSHAERPPRGTLLIPAPSQSVRDVMQTFGKVSGFLHGNETYPSLQDSRPQSPRAQRSCKAQMLHSLIYVFPCQWDIPVFPQGSIVRTNDVSDRRALCACTSGDGP